MWEGWFQDDLSTLHLLCTLFLLLFHQLHLRSPGIRSWRLGTSALDKWPTETSLSSYFIFFILQTISCSVKSIQWKFQAGPIELRPFGHVPLILAKGQCSAQSSYSTQLHLIHLGKLNCTWLFQAQLDCALKFPHSIWLCSKCVVCHLVTCRFRQIPKGGTFREA